MSCVICNDDAVSRPDDFKLIEVNGRVADSHCKSCGSRARLRGLARLLAHAGARNNSGHLGLMFSASGQERRLYRDYIPAADHVSLFGDHGDAECRLGTDITCMPSVESGHYSHAIALCVLDYIPEIEKAFAEIARVLRPGGEFAFMIMPYRVVEEGPPVRVAHYNALAHEAYAKRDGEITGVPDCRFNRYELPKLVAAAGLEFSTFSSMDESRQFEVEIFRAKKPV